MFHDHMIVPAKRIAGFDIEHTRLAAFLVGSSRRIETSSRAATLLGFTEGLAIGDMPFEADDRERFAAALSRLNWDHRSKNIILFLAQIDQERPMPVCISRVGNQALVQLSQIAWPDALSSFLTQNFALTPTELSIAEALCIGLSIKNIMLRRQCSLATVRSHISSLLSKTDTRSQCDLVGLIHALSAMVSDVDRVAFEKDMAFYSGAWAPFSQASPE
jgi:DNA-binding CsgD family transcriptional regulator